MILKMDKNTCLSGRQVTHKFTEISPLNPDLQGAFFTILRLVEAWYSGLPEETILRTKYRVIIGELKDKN
jgi:hypothetical protein